MMLLAGHNAGPCAPVWLTDPDPCESAEGAIVLLQVPISSEACTSVLGLCPNNASRKIA